MSLTYRQLTSSDSSYFPEGIELLNRTQGRDLFPANYLVEKTSQPHNYVIAAFNENELVGLGVAEIINTFDYYMRFDSNIKNELNNKKVGSFSTLCIAETFQGKGIGQVLSKYRYEWLMKHMCEVIVGVSWVSGLPHTSDRVFQKMGFRPVKKVEKFYYQSSIENPFVCPGCGEPPCDCGAIMYRLDMATSELL